MAEGGDMKGLCVCVWGGGGSQTPLMNFRTEVKCTVGHKRMGGGGRGEVTDAAHELQNRS